MHRSVRAAFAIAIAAQATYSLQHWQALAPGANSEAPKVLFFAGVEGAGHDILEALWDKYAQNDRILSLPPQWECGKEWAIEGIDVMKNVFRRLKHDEMWSLPQRRSFPECYSEKQSHADRMYKSHPRIDFLMKAADEAHVDLHVILLHRPLKECLSVDCFNEESESCALQSETLKENAKIMTQEISGTIDLNKLSCVRFGQNDEIEKQIREVMGFDLETDDLIHGLLEKNIPVAVRKNLTAWPEILKILGNGDVNVARLCRESNQIDLEGFKYMLDPINSTSKIEHTSEGDFKRKNASKVDGFNCCKTCRKCICCRHEE